MLGIWRTHEDYQQFVREELAKLAPSRVYEYEKEISKLYILDLDILINRNSKSVLIDRQTL